MKKILLSLVLIIIVGLLTFFIGVYGVPSHNSKESGKEPDNHSTPLVVTPVPHKEVMNEEINETQELDYEKGLFSWENDVHHPRNRVELYVIMNYLDVNEVYQDFGSFEIDDKHAKDLAHELDIMDVDLYILTGDSEWTYEADGKPMIEVIDQAVEYRASWGNDAIKGIVFDIEPYGSERWKQGDKELLMGNYVSGMKEAYKEAQEKGLRIILCIPTWYQKSFNEYFVELMEYCDEVSVMNYVRADEYKNIIDEIEYARTMNKDITCIFEFQPVGAHDLTNEQTYHNEGLDAAIQSFEDLYAKADYENLKFAYHYLKPLRELVLEKE